jgi:hypothetical protein
MTQAPNPLAPLGPLDVLSYADKRHWEALKQMTAQAVKSLRAGAEPKGWELSFLADLLDSVADYAAVLRSDCITEALRCQQSENEGIR